MNLFAHLRPHLFTSHRDGARRYFANHDMPYPVDCALLGHRPVWVALKHGGFVECSRCTLRPTLTRNALTWTAPTDPYELMDRALREGEVYWTPRRAESHLETIRNFVDRFAVQISIGTAGSETPVDAHLIVPWWRGFYVGTSVIGRRLAHRRSRNATGHDIYTTRVWGLSVDSDSVRWECAARKHESSSSDPWWMQGHWSWRDALLGKTQYEKVEGDPVEILIPMPEGDYPAIARTYRQTWTRPRFAKKPKVQEGVDFRIEGGVPNGRHKYGDWDSTWGFAITPSRSKGLSGWETWAPQAAAARLLQDRAGYASADWTPPADARNPRMVTR